MFTNKRIRIIPRLDVKGPNVIKGVHLECLRVMGLPKDLASHYYETGADEIIYIDIVASLYQRNNLIDIVKEASKEIFVPMTVGGGLRSLDDMEAVLRAGADKVAINTAAINDPNLITKGAKEYGSQCIVVYIEAKKQPDGNWEAYTDNGRNETGFNVIDWAKKAEEYGAGEILITSVDKEGTAKGFDIKLIKSIREVVNIPIIASGGAGSFDHIKDCIVQCNVDAIATAHLLHYNKLSIPEIKDQLYREGIKVRINHG